MSKLKMYAALRSISDDAWDIVRVATNSGTATNGDDEDATEIVASATFTEGLLRNILDLTAEQQLSLCKKLHRGGPVTLERKDGESVEIVPLAKHGANQHRNSGVGNAKSKHNGTTADYTKRRLARDRPDLLVKVQTVRSTKP